MFINIGTDCNVKDRLIDNINGTNIFLFGHTTKQYKQRIDKLRRNFKFDKLDYNHLVNEALQAIRDNYDECLTKNGERVWKSAIGEFEVNCDKQRYKMEVSVLIKSTRVAWEPNTPHILAEDYREYVESGIIKLGDKVITIETMVLTIRSADVKERQNFTEFDIVRKINLGKTKIKMTPQEFRNTFDNSIICSYSMTESKAWQKIKITFAKYGIRMK